MRCFRSFCEECGIWKATAMIYVANIDGLKVQVQIQKLADGSRRALSKCRYPVKSLASPRRKFGNNRRMTWYTDLHFVTIQDKSISILAPSRVQVLIASLCEVSGQLNSLWHRQMTNKWSACSGTSYNLSWAHWTINLTNPQPIPPSSCLALLLRTAVV